MPEMETPPNYSQYPRPGQPGAFGGGSTRGYRGPGVYFDFISDSFNIVKNNMGVYLIGALLTLVIFYAVQIPFSLLSNSVIYGSPMGQPKIGANGFPIMNWMGFPVSIALGIIPGAIFQACSIGISLCALEEADTGTTNLNTMFSGFKNFLPLLGTVVLVQILSSLGIILCCVGFFVVAALLSLAPLYTVHEGLNPIEAIQKSFKTLMPFALPITGFYFLSSIVAGLGVCACGIGVLFTYSVLPIGIALHYREFRGPLNQGFVAPTMTP